MREGRGKKRRKRGELRKRGSERRFIINDGLMGNQAVMLDGRFEVIDSVYYFLECTKFRIGTRTRQPVRMEIEQIRDGFFRNFTKKSAKICSICVPILFYFETLYKSNII